MRTLTGYVAATFSNPDDPARPRSYWSSTSTSSIHPSHALCSCQHLKRGGDFAGAERRGERSVSSGNICNGFGNDRVAEDFRPSNPEIGSFYSERVGKGFLSAELPPDSVLGEGGSERVYKRLVDEKTRAPTRNGTGVAVSSQEAQLGEHAGVRGMTGLTLRRPLHDYSAAGEPCGACTYSSYSITAGGSFRRRLPLLCSHKTLLNPPSPRTLSSGKFLVAVFSSTNVKVSCVPCPNGRSSNFLLSKKRLLPRSTRNF
ncbi:uncharacterized protein [Miscanthus floridulus]|uniref:uncharacterized protein n=1 Tax=Miscanthus floridulus TaxID=154761 RepID=UPI00345B0F03